MKIVFINDEGGIAVIHPTPEALAIYGIEAIAIKDVPAGKPFKFVEDKDVPDRQSRGAWDICINDLTDGVGGDSSEFPPPKEQPSQEDAVDL